MHDGEDGFTLTETLVALFIMIAAATLLYRGFASGLAAANTADAQQMALNVAKSRLAAVGPIIPLDPGQHEGAENGIAWTLAVTPYAARSDGVADEDAPRLRAFWATVVVSWRDRGGGPVRSLQLTTLKLGGVR
jgi:hypothetical protein